MSDIEQTDLMKRLRANPFKQGLVGHEFFRLIRSETYSKDQVAVFIGQWWHPLHYFPTFLARAIAAFPDIASKCAAARILNQETGEGDPKRAHESIYIDTMVGAGFDEDSVSEVAPFAETEALVASYAAASQDRLSALGFIFATEIADLIMVSGIGEAVRRATGTRQLEWVRIHALHEPDHIKQADNSLVQQFSEEEESAIISSAELMWQRWIVFFDRLTGEIFGNVIVNA